MARGEGRPLRVVQVVRSAMYGGVENHVYELCRNFKERGIDVTLISLVDCEANRAFRDLGIDIIRLNDSMEWSSRVVGAIFDLRRVLRRLNPDIVHLHGIRPTLVGGLAACRGIMIGGAGVVSTLHGSYSLMAVGGDGEIKRHLLLMAKLFHWIGFSMSNRVVLDCRRLTEEVKNVYRGLTFSTDGVIRRKVRVVYNSIDLRPFEMLDSQRDIRAIVGIPEDSVVVGTISRLDEPKKGLAVLLRAARRVMDRLPEAHLVICGDGYSRSVLEKLAMELRIDDRVHFLGYWENALEVYRMLDLFVLPSFSEGFPTVNLEAMAAGLPVITTDVGGAAEAVIDGDCGYVVPPMDADALADAILRLSDDISLRSAMGSRAKSIVCERFASDKMAKGILDVYEGAIVR